MNRKYAFTWAICSLIAALLVSVGPAHAGLVLTGGGLTLVEEFGTFAPGNLASPVAGSSPFAIDSLQSPPAGTVVPGGIVITVEVAVAPAVQPVPNVIGLTLAEAKQALSGYGFGVEVEVLQNVDVEGETRSDRVWAQNPAAGSPGDGIDNVQLKVNPEPDPDPNADDNEDPE